MERVEEKKEHDYPLYTRMITLVVNSDHRDYGTATNFYMTIPNSGLVLPNTPINVQCIQFGTDQGDPLVNGAAVPLIQLRGNLSQTNMLDTERDANGYRYGFADILVQVPRYQAAAYFWTFQAYDKTFFAARTNEFFGKTINFRVTDQDGNVVTGFNRVYFVLQIFY